MATYDYGTTILYDGIVAGFLIYLKMSHPVVFIPAAMPLIVASTARSTA
jgi:hypothetical protein